MALLLMAGFEFYRIVQKGGDRSLAISRMLRVKRALREFEAEYDRFPDASTAPLVKAKTGTPLSLNAASSNQLFRQLLAYGLEGEDAFHAGGGNSRSSDGNFSDDIHALAPGECDIAYVSGLSSDDAEAPLIMTPMIRGTTRFDRKIYGGYAIVVLAGGGVVSYHLDKSGYAIFHGMDLFDPRQPYWHGKAPAIVWPE